MWLRMVEVDIAVPHYVNDTIDLQPSRYKAIS